jgi:hypothetical protein
MQVFRQKCFRWLLTVTTGIIFLNMGFFLMEVKLLGLDQDREIMANITRMMAGAAFEEERDASTQSSGTGFAEEEYLIGHHSNNYSGCYFLIAEHGAISLDDGSSEHGYLKKFCPPPEI